LRRMKIVAFWIGVIGIIIIRIGIRRWIRVPVRRGISIGIIITVTGIGGTGGHETTEKEKEDILLLHKFYLTSPPGINWSSLHATLPDPAEGSPYRKLQLFLNFNAL
jgi:hypothetical protein